jgi:hypothetical protein
VGGWDWEDQGSRPARANSSWKSISKITSAKWIGWGMCVALAVMCLLCKHEVLNSNPNSTKKNHVLGHLKDNLLELGNFTVFLPLFFNSSNFYMFKKYLHYPSLNSVKPSINETPSETYFSLLLKKSFYLVQFINMNL